MKHECLMSLCNDGRMHGFRVLDDGEPSPTALCGAGVRARGYGDDDTPVCESCLPLVAAELGLPTDAFGDPGDEN